MHIEFRITEKSYRAAAMLAMRKRSTVSKLDYYGPYIFCIVWLAVSFLNPDADFDLLLTLGVLPIVLGFLALRRKRIKREYAKLKDFHLLQVLDLDAAGLRLITTAGTSRSAWQVYSKVAEDANSFILYLHAGESFLPIPKGELTLIQIDELRSLLEARLPHD
jgi:YcxB-like protein